MAICLNRIPNSYTYEATCKNEIIKKHLKKNLCSSYPGRFRSIKKLYPRANWSLEKYSPLNIKEEGGESWGPWRVKAHPKFNRNKDQYVQIDMYDNAKNETACITTSFKFLCGEYAPIINATGDLHPAAMNSSLHNIVKLNTPHNAEKKRHDVLKFFAEQILW